MPSRGARVAFFSMAALSHFRRCRALLEAMTASGFEVTAFTGRQFEAEAVAAGAAFVDMFENRPLAAADDVSVPLPCRYVTWAGRFAAEVIEQARRFDPDLIVLDSFAVIGRVVARALGVPHVNVCAGHNISHAKWIPIMQDWPAVAVSAECERQARCLRDEYGLEDASPLCWIAPPSPYLNVYCEPPEFLTEEERGDFEPLAFFGSISQRPLPPGPDQFSPSAELKVYVSLGTFSWVEWPRESHAAARAIVAQLSELPGVETLFGTGVAPREMLDELAADTVRVTRFADQRSALSQADVFITHHGLNSTHEAIFHGVPMLSYPFLWDQPELAARCQEFGLAVALVDAPLAPLGAGAVAAALDEVRRRRAEIGAALRVARGWEEAVIAGRPGVIARIGQLTEN